MLTHYIISVSQLGKICLFFSLKSTFFQWFWAFFIFAWKKLWLKLLNKYICLSWLHFNHSESWCQKLTDCNKIKTNKKLEVWLFERYFHFTVLLLAYVSVSSHNGLDFLHFRLRTAASVVLLAGIIIKSLLMVIIIGWNCDRDKLIVDL